jgi:acetolactate synthase small subunit
LIPLDHDLRRSRVLARLRISVPDRPGSLGRVASVIGTAGADIAKVDVLESEAGRALDDVFVQVRDGEHLLTVESQLASLPGVTIVGVQQPVPPVTGHADLELIDQVLSRPERALQTLVDGAPGALGSDWAAVVAYDLDGDHASVLATSPQAPAPQDIVLAAALRLTSVRLPRPGAAPGSSDLYPGAVLVPLGTTSVGLLLVRENGPDFHRSELWRLGQVGHIVSVVVPAPV